MRRRWRRDGVDDGGLFRHADPAGEVEDLRHRAEKDASDDKEDAYKAYIPSIGLRKTGADAGKLASEDGTHQPRRKGCSVGDLIAA